MSYNGNGNFIDIVNFMTEKFNVLSQQKTKRRYKSDEIEMEIQMYYTSTYSAHKKNNQSSKFILAHILV